MSVPAATAAGRARAVAAPATAGVAGSAPAGLPVRVPPFPRRVSGPARHPRAASAQPAVASARWLRLIDHAWLDRLIRGRAWIAIVAVALLGIVAVQVALLRLGAQIGSETTAVNALIAHNQTARATIGAMEASGGLYGDRATARMIDPAPNDVTYMRVNSGDLPRALARMRPPSSAAIAAEAAAASFTASHAATSTVTVPVVTTAPATTTTGATGATGVTATTGTTSASGTAAAATGATATGATATTTAATTTAATTPAATGTTGAAGTTAATTTTTTPATGTGAPANPPATSQGGAVVAPASSGG